MMERSRKAPRPYASAEPRAEDRHCLHASPAARFHDTGNSLGRRRNHGQIDGAGDFVQRTVHRGTVERVGTNIDRMNRASKSAPNEVRIDDRTHRLRVVTRPEHCHAARCKEFA